MSDTGHVVTPESTSVEKPSAPPIETGPIAPSAPDASATPDRTPLPAASKREAKPRAGRVAKPKAEAETDHKSGEHPGTPSVPKSEHDDLQADHKKALEILGRLVEHEGQWVEHTVNGRREWVFHPSESQETQDALALGVKVPEHRE